MRLSNCICIILTCCATFSGANSFASQDCSDDSPKAIRQLIATSAIDEAQNTSQLLYTKCEDKDVYAFLMAQIAEIKQDPQKSYDYLKIVLQEVESGKKTQITKQSVYNEFARLALTIGKFEESISYLKKLEAINPKATNLQYMLALAYSGLKKEADARHYFEACMAQSTNAEYQKFCRQNLTPAQIVIDKKEFQAALAVAKTLEKDDRLEFYRKTSFSPHFGKRYSSVLKNCFSTTPQPNDETFNLVLQINASGNMEKVFLDKKTNIAECMLRSLKLDVYTQPPIDVFYEHIEMRFTK